MALIADSPPDDASQLIYLAKGYSRDHRPDLNQVVLNMIVENRAGIHLHMKALSGNSNDKAAFSQTIEQHIDNLNTHYTLNYLLIDSAGYTSETLTLLGAEQHWISKVPEPLSAAWEAVSMKEPA